MPSDIYMLSAGLNESGLFSVTIGEETRDYVNAYIAGINGELHILCIHTDESNIEWLKQSDDYLADCKDDLSSTRPDVYAKIDLDIVWLE